MPGKCSFHPEFPADTLRAVPGPNPGKWDLGIDTSVYKAHSTRSACVSKAKSQGLSVDQILQRANWSQANTFYKFYDKKVQSDNAFQDAVLTSN